MHKIVGDRCSANQSSRALPGSLHTKARLLTVSNQESTKEVVPRNVVMRTTHRFFRRGGASWLRKRLARAKPMQNSSLILPEVIRTLRQVAFLVRQRQPTLEAHNCSGLIQASSSSYGFIFQDLANVARRFFSERRWGCSRW